jgi:hypothetical protein
MITNKRAYDANFLLEVQKGNVPGHRLVNQPGRNPDMEALVEETIWDNCCQYVYLTADTTLYASSSNASDTAVTLAITGLDDTYTPVTRTVTLNGQNQVALSGDMFRIFQVVVTGSVEPLGDVYIAEADTLTLGVPNTVSKIKSKILIGRNVTQNGFYTVPAGETAYLIRIVYIAAKGVDVSFAAKVKLLGGVFFTYSEFPLYQSVQESEISGVSFPGKTDLEIAGTASNAGSVAAVTATLLLIED